MAAVLVLLAWAPLVLALPVSGLYQQSVAVADEGEAERERAYRLAFQRMIVKLTGDERWLEHAAIKAAAGNAGHFVQAFAYATKAAPGQPGGQRHIEVQFSVPLIRQLLAAENIPVWGSNRPSVLVWMALQDTTGQRKLLDRETGPEIIGIIRDFAEERGLPVIFPVLDLEDRRNLSADSIWAQDQLAIEAASDRYDPDSILAGRLLFTATGELVGLWQFLFMDEEHIFDGYDSSLDSYLEKPLARVAAELAGYFALTPYGQGEQSIRLRVDGIGSFSDYSALFDYVRAIELVESAKLTTADGERLELLLDCRGGAEQLFNRIALDRELMPVQREESAGLPLLHYRWMR